ncbi:MAG: hypothetical protein JWP37_2218 [Mucilaginibacter sp.]|nr:hypothetical protein [Mucilaginibacter sp.]
MKYNDYLLKLSKKVAARLQEIEAVYNFDFGDEYEIALCHLLSDILPKKFGVCKGFIVNEDSEIVGDDLIIYDKLGYPTLRSSIGESFDLKDQIPVEAVYAYIECKHTLNIESLHKAITQIKNAKRLLLTRDGIKYSGYDSQLDEKHSHFPYPLPKLRNQPFGMIFSRFTDKEITADYLNKLKLMGDETTPDLIVCGGSYIMTQTAVLGPDGFKASLFYNADDKFPLLAESTGVLSDAIGIVCLLNALSWLELDVMNFNSILNEGFWKTYD